MLGRLSHTRLLRHAGLFTWAMVGVPLVYSQYVPADGGDDLGAGATRTAWLFACYLGFGASYWWLSRGLGQGSARWPDRALLLLLTVLSAQMGSPVQQLFDHAFHSARSLTT